MRRVRALQTIKYQGRWYVPGTATEVFEVPNEIAARLGGSVEILGVPEEAAPVEVGLPEDFPARSILMGHGINSVDDLPGNISTLKSLKGIGSKSIKAIAAYLDGLG